jgi:hypothetical protein
MAPTALYRAPSVASFSTRAKCNGFERATQEIRNAGAHRVGDCVAPQFIISPTCRRVLTCGEKFVKFRRASLFLNYWRGDFDHRFGLVGHLSETSLKIIVVREVETQDTGDSTMHRPTPLSPERDRIKVGIYSVPASFKKREDVSRRCSGFLLSGKSRP